jgi:outer membrane protein TolC
MARSWLIAFAFLGMQLRAAEVPPAAPEAGEKVLPINLATALRLANASPIDVQIAGRQVELAAAAYDRAKVLWVPNLVMGADYFRHDGGQQNFAGEILNSSRSTVSAGLGPNVVFSFADAIYTPLAAKQDLAARRAYLQTANNDSVLGVAEVYFNLQQARGELAGALYAAAKAEEVNRIAGKLAEGIAPPLEATRAKVELARRQQVVAAARERWRTASAELARLLRLAPGSLIDPVEPPSLPITVVQEGVELDELIALALVHRPELAGNQAIVQATLQRLKQEKMRPLIPSLAIRSVSTNPSGSIGYGTFGGGAGDRLANFGPRFDLDAQLLWEFQSLGFGNKARVGERKAEHQIATLELFRTQDRIAAEVAQAHAQLKAASERMKQAEPAFRDSIDLVEKSLRGMNQTRRVGDVLVLIVRPQEVVAAVQSLGTANADYASAVADYNRAQFRLYRALGHPGQCLAERVPPTESAFPPPLAPEADGTGLQAFAYRRGLQFQGRAGLGRIAVGEAEAEARAAGRPPKVRPLDRLKLAEVELPGIGTAFQPHARAASHENIRLAGFPERP